MSLKLSGEDEQTCDDEGGEYLSTSLSSGDDVEDLDERCLILYFVSPCNNLQMLA